MHPALSVIFFTTASGAGYGLLALLGIMAAAGQAPASRGFGAAALGLSLALITAGLLASTVHLGRPERAWRAFSQWRSSWLSREGVASVATYVPAALLGLEWVFIGRLGGVAGIVGAFAALGAVVTVICTGMIYASLKPVAQWHSPFTVPGYLLFAAMTGALLLAAALAAFGYPAGPAAVLSAVLIAVTAGTKIAAWRRDDRTPLPATASSAVGLPEGTLRILEWPHTEENYLLKEMAYRVARKHRARLRAIAVAAAFVAPFVLIAGSLALSGVGEAVTLCVAAPVQLAGVFIERWLFFADARHTVTLYYRGSAAG